MSRESAIGHYNIQRLNKENLPDVEKLFTAVYDKQAAPCFFAKKYNTAFTGVEYTGFIAYNDDQPVAFYAVIPCFLLVNNEPILAAQSADTMTHPDHRNKGLFIELALTTFLLCQELNIRVLFGFPNQNSLPGFVKKLGWTVTDTMDCFIIHTGSFSWKRALNKLPVLKKFAFDHQKNTIKRRMAEDQRLENSVFKDGCDGVYRDDAYFKYKTYNDTFLIKAAGSISWVKTSGALLVGDIKIQADDFDDMIYELKKLANKLGLRQIHFHASPGTTLHSLFAMRFNSIPSFPVIFKLLGEELPLDKIKFTSADIDTF
ncbi:GNAT family N-acetyltransferase [Mucilaginibacter sp. BJC16-A38]|uniref:GNAT family N-acetyltransferase n=1 Tax=Mucilaginibacter phenanthrenivorans TaxID=1234842 RepID=UPI0021584352|nr:GNAT family N-acetyltransferase [Mucilaginibacter phenanthrenivorans]MCR8559975.1 GNAT family N-acetyltransferase [Mucilaginibacter phenanthrenivorans]